MTRTRILFVCTGCGNDSPRWQGQCPACGEWNTLVEEKVQRKLRVAVPGSEPDFRPQPVRLADVAGVDLIRWESGIPELDFVLGGGIVPGSVVLVGGEPGIGKSTLLLQMAARMVAAGRPTLYVAGEESAMQVRMRADRLEESAREVHVLPETELEAILAHAGERKLDLLLVDSIQTVHAADQEGVPGSVGQVRECAARLHRWAKEHATAVFLVGHVTKGGGIAGPKTLEHIVDTVLYFEAAGGVDHRILRATKNRFGGVDEIGVFRMSAEGLTPVDNPSELFLGERDGARPGTVVTALIEGTRPLLVEIQSLAVKAPYGAPQRVAAGFDQKRLALLLAVLEKRAGLPFGQLDVFLNVAGGLRISETAADAAVAVALYSSARDLAVPADSLVLGEVGLGGELRPVAQIDRRIAEAARMGFARAVVPSRSGVAGSAAALPIQEAADLAALFDRVFG